MNEFIINEYVRAILVLETCGDWIELVCIWIRFITWNVFLNEFLVKIILRWFIQLSNRSEKRMTFLKIQFKLILVSFHLYYFFEFALEYHFNCSTMCLKWWTIANGFWHIIVGEKWTILQHIRGMSAQSAEQCQIANAKWAQKWATIFLLVQHKTRSGIIVSVLYVWYR